MVVARRQTLVQLSDGLVAALDERAGRLGVSRSQLIRAAIERYLAEGRDAEIDRAIVEGYERVPQDDDAWADAAALESIREEAW